jgi:hypothetical protein
MAPALPVTLDDVPGWFFWMDRLMFDTMLIAQQHTPNGHLVELGCFLGKSAIAVGAHRRDGERFVVVDLFEHTDLLGSNIRNLGESQRSYSSLTQQAFEQNYQALRGELPEVVAGLSSSVTDHLPPESVRFLHIDASHLYEAVRGDIGSAKQLLRPGGLVVFDDYRSEHTPGTAAAIWEAVAADGLVPVALTPNKMYAVFSDPEPYLAAVEALADDRISTEWHLIAGHRLIRLGESATSKERNRARRQAREDAERARQAAAQDQRMADAVRKAVAADRKERQAAAARAAEQRKTAQTAEQSRRPAPQRTAMSHLVDQLFGTRLKASIDRRVRREVGQRHQALSADLPPVIEAEVSRQLTDAVRSRTDDMAKLAAQVAEEVRRQLGVQQLNDLGFNVGLLLGTGRRFDRSVTPARWNALKSEIAKLAGGRNPDWRMRQAFRTLLDHETRGLGRIAGSPYNIVGKLTVPLFLDPPEGPVLEIGTLFGLFSPALIKQFRQAGQFKTLTVIDPLAGHQIQPEHVQVTDGSGTPVTAQVARHNFAVGGLSNDDVRLIEGFSTDAEVRAHAADSQYSVVVVDGDHTERGVYADLYWVETVAAPGAIVIMDDFGDKKWPGVERATRRYLADGGRLDLLGTAATSAYLRMPT